MDFKKKEGELVRGKPHTTEGNLMKGQYAPDPKESGNSGLSPEKDKGCSAYNSAVWKAIRISSRENVKREASLFIL